jgi:putative transcriptional regulator
MNDEDFRSLMQGLQEARAFLVGEDVPGMRVHLGIDIPGIRNRAGMTQEEFAREIGVSVATLRNWEQGRRVPDGSARVLLALLDKDPMIVRRTLAEAA